jgi:hypothetical protein
MIYFHPIIKNKPNSNQTNKIMEKTHWKKNYNYDYLGSYSLPDGKDVTLTISKTAKEKVIGANGKKDDCFVVYFKDADKPMILNRTNAKTITKITGSPFIEDWVGKQIVLGVDTVSAFGELTEALRVRNIKPAPAKAVDYTAEIDTLRGCTSLEQLQSVYLGLYAAAMLALVGVKDEMKAALTQPAAGEGVNNG